MSRNLLAHLAGAIVTLAICASVLLVSACELPTLWERTTYRTERCEHATVYVNGLTTTTTITVPLEGGDTVVVADSVRVYDCDGPAWEGQVIRP